MDPDHTGRPFRGVVPPVVTPLDADGGLDEPALGRVIDHLLGGGVDGLFVLGTTGEGPALAGGVRRRVVDLAIERAAGRVPVLVGVTDSALPAAADLAGHAAEAGAAAAVVAPAPYYPVAPAELAAYFGAVAAAVSLPIVVYNIPSRTQAIPRPVLRELMGDGRFVGFKDSGGDMTYLHHVLMDRDAHRPDWSVLVGPEELLAEATLLGADGGVCGGANLFPALYVALHRAAEAGDLPRVRRLHREVMTLVRTLYSSGQYGSSFLKSLKGALHAAGLCGDTPAEPYQPFRPDDLAAVGAAYHAAAARVAETLADGAAA